MDGEQIILLALSLVDLSLTANLLLIVIFAGYENFVSKVTPEQSTRPVKAALRSGGGLGW